MVATTLERVACNQRGDRTTIEITGIEEINGMEMVEEIEVMEIIVVIEGTTKTHERMEEVAVAEPTTTTITEI